MKKYFNLSTITLNNTEKINNLVKDLLANKGKVVVLTGAGVSTLPPTNLRTFNGNNGIYTANPKVIDALSLSNFINKGGAANFYYHYREFYTMDSKRTNIIHKFLAQLQKQEIISTIITQNIDNLHQKALDEVSSSENSIIDLHGTITKDHVCLKCNKIFKYTTIKNKLSKELYFQGQCDNDKCEGNIKPPIIFYEENPNKEKLEQATLKIKEADLLLIIGTALKIAPAAELPQKMLKKDKWEIKNGKKIYVLNDEKVPLDEWLETDINYRHIYDDFGEVFKLIISTYDDQLKSKPVISKNRAFQLRQNVKIPEEIPGLLNPDQLRSDESPNFQLPSFNSLMRSISPQPSLLPSFASLTQSIAAYPARNPLNEIEYNTTAQNLITLPATYKNEDISPPKPKRHKPNNFGNTDSSTQQFPGFFSNLQPYTTPQKQFDYNENKSKRPT